jgi:hypothetical protein
MNWYRKYPLFASGLTLCGLVALGELALIYERYAASRDSAKRLEQRRAELEGMAQLTPPPTREVAGIIESDLAKAQKSLAAMQAELTGRGPAADRLRDTKVPTARTDSYFDLATFVERMREVADKNGVEVRADAARFGFSKYVNEGPEADRIEPVFRQRLIAEFVIGALLESRPRSFLGVKRVRTVTKAEKEARAAALANGVPSEDAAGDSEGESGDYFAVGPGVTARVPGYVETTGFRVSFISQTATLRNFLNRLATFELPILVREVEVEAASAEETLASAGVEPAPAPISEAPVAASVVLATESAPVPATKARAATERAGRTTTPIVPKSFSKFTVTLEYIELLPAPVAAADGAEAAPNT